MVGAYQEILGDMHNLFGDTDSVHVVQHADGYHLVEPLLGDSIESVLKAVHFDARVMLRNYKHQIQNSTYSHEHKQFMEESLASSLLGGTYLEPSEDNESFNSP